MYVKTRPLQIHVHIHILVCTFHNFIIAGTSPHVSDVFRLYCGLEAGQTVKDMCMVHDLRTMNVDERYIYTVCTCTCMCMQMTKCMVTFPFSLFHNCTIHLSTEC